MLTTGFQAYYGWEFVFDTLTALAAQYVGVGVAVVGGAALKAAIEKKAADFIWNHTAGKLWDKANKVWDDLTGSGHDLVGSKAHYSCYKMAKPGQGKSKKALARRRRRAGGAASSAPKARQPRRSAAYPQLRGRMQAAKGRARGRGGNRIRGASSWNGVSDGLNNGVVIENDSTIEDRFPRRTEKIQNINGSSAFTLTPSGGLYINPGNSVMFPIFSQIASTYEEYRCNYLEFKIGTEAYTAVSSTASAGKVIMATSFNVDASAFANDTQMENYEGMTKAPPFVSFKHDVLKAHRKRKGRGNSANGRNNDLSLNNYFVYSSGNSAGPSNSTDKFYDIGLFQLATASNAVTTEIGELYVTYSFTMIRPKAQVPSGNNLLQAHIVEGAAATGSNTNPLGTTGGVLRGGSTLPSVCTKTTFTLPVAGTWAISMQFNNGAVTAVPTYTLGANLAYDTILKDTTVGAIDAVSSGVSVSQLVVTVSASGTAAANTFTFTGGLTNFVTGTTDIIITQVSTGLLLGYEDEKHSGEEVVQDRRIERLEALVRRLTLRLDDDCYDDDVKDKEDCHESGDPYQTKRASTPLKGDYVIRSDGRVEPMSRSSPAARLSKSVLTTLGLSGAAE